MEIPLASLKGPVLEEAGASLEKALAAAKSLAETVGSRFRISTEARVRDLRPGDADSVNVIAAKVGLRDIYEESRVKVLEADGFGIVGYSEYKPARIVGDSKLMPNELDAMGVLPEFRNKSKLLLDATFDEMKASNQPWYTLARDDTFGRLMHYWEKRGIIDVERRDHGGIVSGLPGTQYHFRVNSDADAAIARESIHAKSLVRSAEQADVEAIQKISDKYGQGWTYYSVPSTKVVETEGYGVTGFAYLHPNENRIFSLGVLPRFPDSTRNLIHSFPELMSRPARPIQFITHQSTGGNLIKSLEKSGDIKINSEFSGDTKNWYEFTVNPQK